MEFEKMRQPYIKRLEVFKRDGYRCQICGQQAPNTTITIIEENGDWTTVCTACAAGLKTDERTKPISFSVQVTEGPTKVRPKHKDTQPVRVLQFIKNNPSTSVEEMVNRLDIPLGSIRVVLHRLRKAGLIKY